MKQISEHLYQTEPDHPFDNDVKTHGYLLVREGGNFLIYSSGTLRQEETFVQNLGGIHRQYLSHMDEAAKSCDWVAKAYGSRLVCHKREQVAVTKKCTVHETFPQDFKLEPDFQAIHTPGHSPGSTCYLWESSGRRYLFTGDTIILRNGLWEVVLVDGRGTVEELLQSLKRISDLDFDVLVPSASMGEHSYVPVTPEEKHRQIDAVMDRLLKMVSQKE